MYAFRCRWLGVEQPEQIGNIYDTIRGRDMCKREVALSAQMLLSLAHTRRILGKIFRLYSVQAVLQCLFVLFARAVLLCGRVLNVFELLLKPFHAFLRPVLNNNTHSNDEMSFMHRFLAWVLRKRLKGRGEKVTKQEKPKMMNMQLGSHYGLWESVCFIKPPKDDFNTFGYHFSCKDSNTI